MSCAVFANWIGEALSPLAYHNEDRAVLAREKRFRVVEHFKERIVTRCAFREQRRHCFVSTRLARVESR